MKLSISKAVGISVTVLVSGLASLTASAASSTNATPFGLEIGVATCDAARVKLGQVEESKLDGKDFLLIAVAPSQFMRAPAKLL
jgi:hypothetical protein